MSVSNVSSGQTPTQIQSPPQTQPVAPVKSVKRDSDGDNDSVHPDHDSDDASQSKSVASNIQAAQAAGAASSASGSPRGSFVNITA